MESTQHRAGTQGGSLNNSAPDPRGRLQGHIHTVRIHQVEHLRFEHSVLLLYFIPPF